MTAAHGVRFCVVAALLAVSTLLFAGAIQAEAASLKKFRVRDAGSKIVWKATVCDAARVRRFSARLEPEDVGIPFTRRWSGGYNGSGCSRWTMRAKDVWAEQVWWSRLTVVLSNGEILRTDWRDFYID